MKFRPPAHREECTPCTVRDITVDATHDAGDHLWVVESTWHARILISTRIVCYLPDGEAIAERDYPRWPDCPVAFFALAPNVVCEDWRAWCWTWQEERLTGGNRCGLTM